MMTKEDRLLYEKLVELLEETGMLEGESRCEIAAQELICSGVTFEKHGEWVYCDTGGYVCSICDCWMEDYYGATPKMMRYCFHCGAKMTERDE